MFESDYTLLGKHATYTKHLYDSGVFARYIDVYMNGAILGFLNGRKATLDRGSLDRARIYADAFIKEKHRCDFLFRLLMLLDETTACTIEQRVDRAFRQDAQGDIRKEENLKLFHSYVLGGIEVLYEKLGEHSTTRDDYVNKVYGMVKTFKEEVEGIPYDEKISEEMAGYTAR